MASVLSEGLWSVSFRVYDIYEILFLLFLFVMSSCGFYQTAYTVSKKNFPAFLFIK